MRKEVATEATIWLPTGPIPGLDCPSAVYCGLTFPRRQRSDKGCINHPFSGKYQLCSLLYTSKHPHPHTHHLPAMLLVSVMPGMPTMQPGFTSPQSFLSWFRPTKKISCSTGLFGQQLMFSLNPKGLVKLVKLVRLELFIKMFKSSSYFSSLRQKDSLPVVKAVCTSAGHLKSFTAFRRRTLS